MLPSLFLSLAIASMTWVHQHLHHVARQANSSESLGHMEAVRELQEYRRFYRPALEADAVYLEGSELSADIVTALEVVFPHAPASLSSRCRWKYLWYYFRNTNGPGQVDTARELSSIDKQRAVTLMVALLQEFSTKETPPLFTVRAAVSAVIEHGQHADRSLVRSLRFLDPLAEIETLGAFASHGYVQQAQELVRHGVLLNDEDEFMIILDLLFDSPCAPLLASVLVETSGDGSKQASILRWATQCDIDLETCFPPEVQLSTLPPRCRTADYQKKYRIARRQLLRLKKPGSRSSGFPPTPPSAP